jgi:CDP-4-dehydro-6-deoxyglucose reductase
MLISTVEGKEFDAENNQTILEAALGCGLFFEYSCKTGQCGVCKVTLLKGKVTETQAQLALTDIDASQSKILTCCCAPMTDILIDSTDLKALHGIEIKTLPARVNRVSYTNENILEVSLRLPSTANFDFVEGQYIDVILNTVRRSYSIASTSIDNQISLIIKRFKNGQMSDYWFNKVQLNDLLRIEGPKGTFFLREADRPLVFLATGTGIAPIKSMLNRLESDLNYVQSHPITVYWGNRECSEFTWCADFTKLKVDFHHVLSRPNDDWFGYVGYIQELALSHHKNLSEVAVYACGSNAMIQTSRPLFIEAGLPESAFYSDAFVQSF